MDMEMWNGHARPLRPRRHHKGDLRTRMEGGKVIVEEYNGKRWTRKF